MLAFQFESELWHIRRIWDPWFHIYGNTAQRTVALKRPIFKWKKEFANLSLGLISYSMASSQPTSLPFKLIFFTFTLSINVYICKLLQINHIKEEMLVILMKFRKKKYSSKYTYELLIFMCIWNSEHTVQYFYNYSKAKNIDKFRLEHQQNVSYVSLHRGLFDARLCKCRTDTRRIV
jgi:hypothetical protein